MSLHTPPSNEAKRRVRWQRVVCTAAGVAVAMAIVTAAGMILDGIGATTGPEYLPMFTGWSYEPETGCGIITCCGPSRKSIVRKPAGLPVRPLGLASSKADRVSPFPVEDSDTVIPKVEFTDPGGFGWGEEMWGASEEFD